MDKLINRDLSIDLMRVLACISVVFMHVTSTFWYKVPVRMLSIGEYKTEISEYIANPDLNFYQSLGWYICSFLDALTRFSVPCFVMISGALILTRESVPLSYIKKKILYILKLILVWGTVQTIIMLTIGVFTKAVQSPTYYIQTIINGNGVFWFLYMLLALYIGSPVLNVVLKNRYASNVFLVLWFVFTICLESAKTLFPSLGLNVKFSYLGLFSSYSGYFFVGGYLMSRWKDRSLFFNKYKTSIGLMGLVMVLIITFGPLPGFFHNFLTPFCVIYTVSCFILLKQVPVRPYVGNKICSLAKYSMEIYALHPCILVLVKLLWEPSLEAWAMQLPVYFVFCMLVCLPIAAFVKKMPVIRNL